MYTLLVYFVFEESSVQNLKRMVYEIWIEQCTKLEENSARIFKRTMHEIWREQCM